MKTIASYCNKNIPDGWRDVSNSVKVVLQRDCMSFCRDSDKVQIIADLSDDTIKVSINTLDPKVLIDLQQGIPPDESIREYLIKVAPEVLKIFFPNLTFESEPQVKWVSQFFIHKFNSHLWN